MFTHVESGNVVRATGRKFPLPVVGVAHERSHEGLMYHTGVRDEALGNDAALDLLAVVNSGTVHARHYAKCGGDAIVDIYEDPFTDANSLGTGGQAHNRNRAFPDSHQSSIYFAPFTNVLSLGTTLDDAATIAAGTGGNSGGGGAGDAFFEWTLVAGCSYLFRLTNRGGAAKIASNELNFYEKDD